MKYQVVVINKHIESKGLKVDGNLVSIATKLPQSRYSYLVEDSDGVVSGLPDYRSVLLYWRKKFQSG